MTAEYDHLVEVALDVAAWLRRTGMDGTGHARALTVAVEACCLREQTTKADAAERDRLEHALLEAQRTFSEVASTPDPDGWGMGGPPAYWAAESQLDAAKEALCAHIVEEWRRKHEPTT